jgi:AraC-like DNA-binding protein
MRYYTIKPSPLLSDFVRFFWVFENEVNGRPYIYRSMADGCAEMIFHYKGHFIEIEPEKPDKVLNKQPLSLIHSQSDYIKEFKTAESFGIFGVYFYPFALPVLFSLPSYDFINQTINLQSLLGSEGKELEEKIMTAPDNNRRVEIVSAFFEKKLVKSKIRDYTIHSAIKEAIHTKGLENVSMLAEKFNYSVRQFERKFKEYSGFNPKLYLRIIRFGNALKEYNNNNKSLTEIAYKCGYYDQSHFIHDFKLFSGYYPKEYFKGQREDAELRV